MRIIDPKNIPAPIVPGARGSSGLSLAGWEGADGRGRHGALLWFVDDMGAKTGVLLTLGEFNGLRDMLAFAAPGMAGFDAGGNDEIEP